MKKGHGIGFGKAILFNEHFVVYGIPSIVSAIGNYTAAKIEPYDHAGFTLSDKRPATPKYKEDKLSQQKESFELMFKKMGLDLSKKVGASAASCVAVARALADFFEINLSDDEINEIAFEGEKGYHGTPSGVDNTASTYGGLIWFQKGEKNVIDRITLSSPVEIVIGNTGKVTDTKIAVDGVRQRKEKNPKKYQEVFDRAENIAYLAKRAIHDGSLQDVGKLMNENHKLLQQIEVSSRELDFLVSVAREAGAYGAKLTGGGLGGNMIALTPGKELQNKVATAIEKEGFQTIKTVIGASRESVE